MTLVVSKIINNKLYVESDSLLTNYDHINKTYDKQPPFCSILKSAIISCKLCISYAGKVKHAEKALKECLKKSNYSVQDIMNILLKNNKESNNETYFAMGIITPNGIKQCKITNGKVQDYTDSLLWLGSPSAFKIFEKIYNKLINTKNDSPEHLKSAFRTVIKDEKIDTVDHFQISIRSDTLTNGEIVFSYSPHLEMKLNTQKTIKIEKAGTKVPIPIDDPKKEISGISYFTTPPLSIPLTHHGIAIHYLSKNIGIFFCPQLRLVGDTFEIIQGITYKETSENFLKQIKTKYKIRLAGFVESQDFLGMKLIDSLDM